MNFLLIESLRTLHAFYGDTMKVACPTGSDRRATLAEVATELRHRLARLFLRGPDGRRPVYAEMGKLQDDPHWWNLILFHEHFHGESGAGLGASHQTGWTALIAALLAEDGT